jgi:cytochrome c biogenesis protein CcdA
MHALLISLVAIAALDSLNPTAIALQIYLLSTPKPISRSIAFIVGVFLAYWASGLLVILGLDKLITTVIGGSTFSLAEPRMYTIQLLIGLALLMAGFSMENSTQTDRGKRPKKLTLARTFLLGLAMTILEFPTALPYLAAIEQIARAKLDLFTIMSLLGIYNLVFVSPLIILVGIYVVFHRQSATLLRRINRSIAIWSPKILRSLLLGLGILLIVDSLAYSFGHSFLKLSQLSQLHELTLHSNL